MLCTHCKDEGVVKTGVIDVDETTHYCKRHAEEWVEKLTREEDRLEDKQYELRQELEEVRTIKIAIMEGLRDL